MKDPLKISYQEYKRWRKREERRLKYATERRKRNWLTHAKAKRFRWKAQGTTAPGEFVYKFRSWAKWLQSQEFRKIFLAHHVREQR